MCHRRKHSPPAPPFWRGSTSSARLKYPCSGADVTEVNDFARAGEDDPRRQGGYSETRKSTRTREGSSGVEAKPKRTGGVTGRSSPSSSPSNRALTDLIRCRSMAEYHSRRPPPALPLVRTPSIATRAIGSCSVVHQRALASPRGTAVSTHPSGGRPPRSKVRARSSVDTIHF